jgi:hypothetical protein
LDTVSEAPTPTPRSTNAISRAIAEPDSPVSATKAYAAAEKASETGTTTCGGTRLTTGTTAKPAAMVISSPGRRITPASSGL